MSETIPSKREIQISKALSYLLRHGAEKEQLNIDEKGYVKLSEILNHNRIKTHRATKDEIEKIVENNDKKRFSLDERDDGTYICANQGHSLKTISDLNLELLLPNDLPEVIYHGTYRKLLPEIIKSGGLSTMSRNHIHFTSSFSNLSGIRKNCNVLIYLDIPKCLSNGITFYKSKNDVILTKGDKGRISHNLFLKVVDSKTNQEINISDYLA